MADYLLLAQINQLIKQLPTHFISFHARPVKCTDQARFSDALKKNPKTAVVVQGPVNEDNDFTLETIRLYKKTFPRSKIILSTWDSSNNQSLEKIKQENIELVLSSLPSNAGPSNINLQIKSTRAGLLLAKKLKSEFVLRTRTDQRIYATSIMEYLLNMIDTFPVPQKFRQNKRLIMTSLDSFKYRLYSVSDMVIFGQIDDLLLYYSAPLDNRKFAEPKQSLLATSQQNICEIYLATHFLKRVGFKVNWTLKNSWQAYAQCFAIVDAETLDLYWPKYERLKEYRHRTYDHVTNKQPLDFKEWFNLYANLANKKLIPERTLVHTFDHPVTYI